MFYVYKNNNKNKIRVLIIINYKCILNDYL